MKRNVNLKRIRRKKREIDDGFSGQKRREEKSWVF